MSAVNEDDDARHRREEEERRAKRKASKSIRPTEKERMLAEQRAQILRKHGHDPNSAKRAKTDTDTKTIATGSAFQEIFTQRAQGFQIDFRFRNAPPRPPVGPCFLGHSVTGVLYDLSKTYKPHNAVEANHTWRLHSEPDIGVPLAPSAMDLKSYMKPPVEVTAHLHPDDEALLNWTGSMGDTTAEGLQRRREQARAAARLAASGQSPAKAPPPPRVTATASNNKNNKAFFSRVLKEDMQTWMKKTTYLSNDYSRKVHDFKSLAQTKSELAVDLHAKQQEMAVRRTVQAIRESFQDRVLTHPTNKNLKPKRILPVLPNVAHWGQAFTHVVIDKAPTTLQGHAVEDLAHALVTDVEKRRAAARMTCQMLVPANTTTTMDDDKDNSGIRSSVVFDPVQHYDLDVIPLKEEDSPHATFCLWVDHSGPGGGAATYVPLASRVQLSVGRPTQNPVARPVERRPLTDAEKEALEERMAEVDLDMAEKHHIVNVPSSKKMAATMTEVAPTRLRKPAAIENDDDGEDDFGDEDSDSDEEVFGRRAKTITADS